MNDRQRNTPRIAPSSAPWWPAELEHVTRAAKDISQLHTHLLRRPTSSQRIAADAPALDIPHAPLPEPIVPSIAGPTRSAPTVSDPRTAAITAHLQNAIRLRKEAEGWLSGLQITASLAADASARWLELIHLCGKNTPTGPGVQAP